jgi:hypothetical protein
MSQDIPVRIEHMKLKLLVDTLSESVLNLIAQIGNVNVLVVADTAALSLQDASKRGIVFMKANGNGQFGIYFPEAAGVHSIVDGANIVSDLVGTTFELFR